MTETSVYYLIMFVEDFGGRLDDDKHRRRYNEKNLIGSCVRHGNTTDRLALIAFKAKITADPLGAMSSWNESIHFCKWYGVTCSRRQHQRVIELDLGHKKLSGTMSPHTGNLSFLKILILTNNSFHGDIPPELGRLQRLEYLWIQTNSFGGEIPANISYCSNVISFGAHFNKLVGKIPMELGSMSKLQDFGGNNNNLTGIIPPPFGNLSSLLLLYLYSNNLVGSIPKELGRLTKLEIISLSQNRLSGTIPPQIFNISSIAVIDVGVNQIKGNLTSLIGSTTLPHLRFFSIAGNQFTGSIPISVSNMSTLEHLILEVNKLTGKVPHLGKCYKLRDFSIGYNHLGSGEANDLSFISTLTNATNLTALAVNVNNFGGVLPESIGNLSTQLVQMLLDNNQISGSIPSVIANLSYLEMLDMFYNQFTGHIPPDFGKFQNLQHLSLSGNQLSGNVPSSLGNLTALSLLRLDQNNLQGNIPSSMGNCQNLLELDLSRNSFNGTIPGHVLGISSLSIALDLSYNHLTGSLVDEVGNLKNLGFLSVSKNMLSGKISSNLGSCQSLEFLYMDGNFFQGTIPSSFSSLKGIQELDLSGNNLSGKIPEYFASFDLKYLNLSFNDFEGPIPKEGIFENASATSLSGNSKLCGGIPEFQFPKCKSKRSKNIFSTSIFKLTISIVSGILGLTLALGFLFICWFRKTNKNPSSDLAGNSLLKVSYRSLLQATNGFSSTNLIGMGSFGSVYKGIIDPDGTIIAVKVLNLTHHGASKSFIAECETLRSIRHRNLVKVLTACSGIDYRGNDFKALVYEFMENGSLEGYLHPNQVEDLADVEPKKLNLLQRVNIAIDVACALDYLHHGIPTPIVHRDIKPSNVLLNNELVGHVGDFGISRFLPADTQNLSTSSIGVRGSIGYTAPEYGMGSDASTWGDVYSFGILLLEMFTGKRPTDNMFRDGLNLHNYVVAALPDQVAEIMDLILVEEIREEEEKEEEIKSSANNNSTRRHQRLSSRIQKDQHKWLISVFGVGVACSKDSVQERMNISDVVSELYSIKNAILQS
ncbi:unnamed protein product [Ilex paraguariensis]|uniref:non-specific serine/threonine protein kinase n=1 Tax=Ilex paraguariensis TaxID=185542 RepID=A0ABC8TPR5_9AQUA